MAATCTPSIATVSAVSTAQAQSVDISGSCLGTSSPYSDADSGYLQVVDQTAGWTACSSGNGITCSVGAWGDSTIDFTGFSGDWGAWNYVLHLGDVVTISVWNPQSGAGPSSCEVVAGGGATDCTDTTTCAPHISSVGPVSTAQTQSVAIEGSCLGLLGGYSDADNSHLAIADETAGWEACINGNGITCSVGAWGESTIDFTGFSGAWGSWNYVLHVGDVIDVSVWNPQSGTGPSECTVVVGGGLPTECDAVAHPIAALRRGCDPAAPGVCDDQVSDVDPGTGDYNHGTTDVSVKSYGPPLTFTRTYDSSLAQEETAASAPGVLGYGWTDNWNVYLTAQASSGTVTVHEPTGAEVQFVPPVSGACPAGTDGPGTAGTYCEAPYVTARLTYDSGTQTYTCITHPYAAEVFDQTGRLVSEFWPGEATLTVSYNTPSPGSGNCPATASSCNTITSASGRGLVIASNSDGQVTSVSDPLGNTWSYAYCSPPSSTCSADDLVSVTDPLGNVTSYTYDQGNSNPSLANDLLTITNPNGQPGGQNAGAHLAVAYNTAGQVTSQTDPAGNKTTFDYSGLDASTGTGDTVTTDPDGNETAYGYTGGIETSKTEAYGTANPSTWTYNPDPNTDLDLSIEDPDHRTTVYTYGGNGNVTSVTDPLGNVSTYSYNSFDEQTCASKPLAAQPCSSLTLPAAITPGGVITPPSSAPPAYVTYSAYDTAGNPVWTTTGDYAPGGNTATQSRTTYKLYSSESVTLDGTTDSCAAAPPAHSLPCLTINPDGVVTQLGYDSSGDLASSSTPDGNAGGEVAETTYGYNADGEQTTAIAPDGNLSGATAADYTTTSTYTADGLLHTQTIGSGTAARETVYGYDADGNQSSIEDARGYTTTKLYNADDQLTLVTDPDNQQTLTCYDGDGNVTETVPASGVAANSLTATSCPASYPAGYGDRLAADATTNTYDALGDKTTITTPAPAGQTGFETTTNTYDLAGQLKTVTAPPASNDSGAPSQVTSYTYDAAGELLSTDQHGSPDSITSYCYDPDGNKTASVAPDGNTGGLTSCSSSAPYQTSSPYQTGYSYDSLGEQVSKTTPSTSFVTNPTTSYSYDPAGNVLTSEDPAGVTTTNTYTPLNQLSSVSYSDATPGASYSYDASGNKLSMSDGTGTSTYTYDPFNELQSYKNGTGNKVSYSYDPDGDLQTLTYPLGAGATWATNPYVTYGYDNADELNSITDFNATTSSLTNTPDGLPKTLSLGSTGDTVTTSYDPTDNPSDIKLANGSTGLQEFAYTDTPSGTTGSETDTPSSPTTPAGYNYDAQGRVTQMTPGSSSPNNYGYDASGNLTTLPTGATGSYDNASELTSSTQSGTATTYTYNKDGERAAESVGGSATVTAGYNGAQELTSYSNSAANMTAATYDGDGLRQSVTTTPAGGSSATENFTWDPSGSLPRLLMDSSNAYIYGPGGTPFEQVNLATGTVQYLLSDQLGSVRGIVGSTGVLTATTSYDAWGNPEISGGLTSHTPFGYAGYYTDPTGLTYNIARYYDPTTGQFFVIDPKVETTLQAYEYANDDPILGTDPTGLDVMAPNSAEEYFLLPMLEDPATETPAQLANRLGQEGEAAVREAYDIGPKATRVIDGRTRIFDGLNRDAVSEIKNVKYQAFTQQLKDDLAYAKENNINFDLYVRADDRTKLSGPLREAIYTNPRFILKEIP